jgi:hypothetical protein
MTYIGMNRLWDAVVIVAIVLAVQSDVMAAVPPNDACSGALAISALPFKSDIDTTQATSASDDPIYAGHGSTVWYTFTSSADARVLLDTLGSSYDTTLFAYTGSPGALHQVAWDDDGGGDAGESRLLLVASAGVTYHVMVGAFDGTGGRLVLSATVAPPPFTIGLWLDSDGSLNARTGVATVRGKVTCSEPAVIGLFGDFTQAASGATAEGSVFTYVACDGEVGWSAEVSSQAGGFDGGSAHIAVTAAGYSRATGEFAEGVGAADLQLIDR